MSAGPETPPAPAPDAPTPHAPETALDAAPDTSGTLASETPLQSTPDTLATPEPDSAPDALGAPVSGAPLHPMPDAPGHPEPAALLHSAPDALGAPVPEAPFHPTPDVLGPPEPAALLQGAPDALGAPVSGAPLQSAPDLLGTPAPGTPLHLTPDTPAAPVSAAPLHPTPDTPAPLVPEPPFHAASQPLHRSDAYSTPPYGQPGPWAEAPPVRHPGEAWGRYDPWRAGPLQQTGEGVLSEGQKRRERWKGILAGAVLIAVVSGGIGGYVGVKLERNGIGGIELPQAAPEPAGRDADSVAGIAARALPSVVTLHVKGSGESGTGTGFVLDDRGHILTNNHVVQPAGNGGEITVVFNGGQAVAGEIVGRDAGYDLAVVRVKGVRNLTPLPLGNSDGVQVGDPVVAIGAPFDLSGTVTSGIISAKERPITAGGDGSDVSYVDALQTDAPINPGNSGGPLLDARGRVIGINSAIRSAGGTDAGTGQSGSVGLGFAIPVNQGKRIAEELIATGRATHPIIGITLDLSYTGQGARVRTDSGEAGPPVTVGGPGDLAGIEPGDVITEVDGRPIDSSDELIVKVRAHRPGDKLELTVVRDGKPRAMSLVLGSAGG
ncbi:trypsin-like peptidase domain-containing protein [Streptomyces sp. NPDC004539]|uniref:S1C family serine protease n=1 Tax=Streptomyces sp. NPDC004539 TaxID=3154280 RepID=UPI00339EA327